MKDIQFTKQGKPYVAEFEVNADFNLHIEKSRSGYLYMQQRSTSGKWDSVRNFQVAENDYIVDYDFTALVYPKQIKLVSEYAPTMCVLTSDGDVIEIKSQSKEVEITQNGEMSVTPDDGFAYLSSVNVKTNVPQQGGEESGGSNVEYLDVSGIDGDIYEAAIGFAMLAKKIGYILPPVWTNGLGGDNEKITAIAVDFTQECYIAEIGSNTLQLSQIIDALGLTDVLSTIPRITKEEFYSTEV